jgi:hypothetical protein
MLWSLPLWGCFTTAWKVLDVLWGTIPVKRNEYDVEALAVTQALRRSATNERVIDKL